MSEADIPAVNFSRELDDFEYIFRNGLLVQDMALTFLILEREMKEIEECKKTDPDLVDWKLEMLGKYLIELTKGTIKNMDRYFNNWREILETS